MADLPTGTVTLLFTDIEGSTRLLQRLGAADYTRLLGDHHQVVRSALAACRGVEVKTEGDSFFAVFAGAEDAIVAAVDVQRRLAAREWPQASSVAVRMGIHTGEVSLAGDEYVGLDIHRAARIAAAAHGGQVLLSSTTRELAGDRWPAGVTAIDLGEHRLKDLDRPERLYQLVIDGLRAQFPPIKALAERFELLPAESTSFVGRDAELGRATELLGATRLLTMTGPGGTGKTRLALRLARSVAAEYEDGVAFVPLASISDPGLVAPTIRQALGLGEDVGRPALDTVIERLHDRRALLVFDNFEQLLPAARVVADLLAATDRLKLIVTSRAVLHVTGEQELPVPPLALPVASDVANLQRLSQSESVALFLARARSVRPDFGLSESNAAPIVEICRRLDGLPLAIELAASRVKLLPPAALLARLNTSLDLQMASPGDRTDRQRTLRGAINWSYELLDEPLQKLFRRLAIFVGGWRLDDAEAIVAAAGPLPIDVLDGLSALVDHSLVRAIDADGEARFSMLETIREFGREALAASAELDAVADAHARHFADLAKQAEPHLTAGREWLDRLDADHANVRAALSWLAERDMGGALLTGGRLWRFWHLRGHLREGAGVLSSLLRAPAARPPTTARAKALIGLAGLVYWQGDYAQARTCYEEALTIAQAGRDERLEVEILYSLAYVRAIERDWAGAARDFAAARTMYEQQHDQLMANWALEAGGMVATLAGEHVRAVEMLEETLARFEDLGDAFGVRNTLSVETRALIHLGRLDDARRLNRRVTKLALEQTDLTSVSQSLHDAASLAALAGEFERAAVLTGAAQRIVEESGGEPPPELVNRIEALPALEREMGHDRLNELLSSGRRMSVDEAVAYALDETSSQPAGD